VSAPQRLVLKLFLAALVLGLLFRFVPIVEVGANLRDVAPAYLLLGIVLQFMVRAVSTPRMRVITANQGVDLSHWQLFRILLITHYYSLLLPGTLSTGGATWMKYVQAGAGKSAALAAIMLNRGIGMLVLVTIGALAWLLDRGPMQSGGFVILFALLAVGLLAAVFGRLPFVPSDIDTSTGPGWQRWIRMMLNRLLQFQQVSTGGKVIVLTSSLARELVGALSAWSFAQAVGLSLDLLTVIWMGAALQVVLMAPVHFAGLGVREASLVGLGALVGVAPAAAVAWSLVIFAGALVVAAAGGLLEADWAARRVSRTKHAALARAPGDSEP
jgi:glycosyltransferase 2 family protein